jgi:hypothetical protein
VTRLQAGGSRVCFLAAIREIFSFPKYPDWLCGPFSLLFDVYRALSTVAKWVECCGIQRVQMYLCFSVCHHVMGRDNFTCVDVCKMTTQQYSKNKNVPHYVIFF